jgi:hypothetical protein
MEFGRIIISETASNSENPQDVIHSNISVINLMRGKIDDDLIHEDADELLFRLLHFPIH